MPLYLRARAANAAGIGGVRGALTRKLLGLAKVLPPPASTHASFTPPDGPQDVRFAAVDSTIVRKLFWFGRAGYEHQTIERWERVASRSNRIVDLGANFGLYTVYAAAANPEASVLAVEPHPRSFSVLAENVGLNDASNVQLIEAAVSERGGERLELCVPAGDLDEAPGGAFLDAADGGVRRTTLERFEVDTVAAAEVLEGADLVKIDVEGQERAILSAAEDVILRDRPVVFLEILGQSEDLTALLADWVRHTDYGLFYVDEAGIGRRVDDARIATPYLASSVGALYDNFALIDERRNTDVIRDIWQRVR